MRHGIYAIPVILLLLGVSRLPAQQFYQVTTSTGAYRELENATVLVSDPNLMTHEFAGAGFRMPFAIEAFGEKLDFDRDTAFFFTGGFLVCNVVSKQRFYIFDAFVGRLAWRDNTSSISCRLEGAPGEQILKVQWKNLGMLGHSPDDFVNMQLWLSEKDNSFEVHVGPNRVTGIAAYYNNDGPAIGGVVADYTLTAFDVALHLKGDPASPGLDGTRMFYPLSATPPNGMVYRFTYTKTSSVEEERDELRVLSFIPNPSGDRSQIRLPGELEGARPTLIVHDALGREVLRMKNVAGGDWIDSRALPVGLYHVTLYQGERVHSGGTLVVAR